MNVTSSRGCVVWKNGPKLQVQTSCVIWGDPPWIQVPAAWSHLWGLQCEGLKAKADGERRPLCKLWTKMGRFQIWKRKLLAGEFSYYLDHWSESYSWFLCSIYEWAKTETVANLKVDRWGGEQSVRWSKSWGDCKERRENMLSLQVRGTVFRVGISYQSCGNLYL